jgi:hypothetical protein
MISSLSLYKKRFSPRVHYLINVSNLFYYISAIWLNLQLPNSTAYLSNICVTIIQNRPAWKQVRYRAPVVLHVNRQSNIKCVSSLTTPNMQYLQIGICQIFQYIVYYTYLLHFIRADHLFFYLIGCSWYTLIHWPWISIVCLVCTLTHFNDKNML